VNTVAEANELVAYLRRRNLKSMVREPLTSPAVVAIPIPRMRRSKGFIRQLTSIVDAWVDRGHDRQVHVDWQPRAAGRSPAKPTSLEADGHQ